MTGPRWLSDDEQRLWLAMIRMRRVIDVAVDTQLAEAGLSAADYDLLAPLSAVEGQTTRVRELAALVGWDRSRIAHQLRRMEERGLITRFECTTDGRGTMVRLTDRGRDTITAAAPGHVETVRRVLFDQLDERDVTALTAIAERVVNASGPIGTARTGSRAAARRSAPAP